MTIGEKLEEARKRKGITIREAAEATKVRGDYLLAMENNSFEISLPEVYVKGFLKIYVNYLRLDTEKLMGEYDAMRQTSRKTPHLHNVQMHHDLSQPASQSSGSPNAPVSAQHASFGRMDMGDGEQSERESTGPSPLPPGTRHSDGGSWVRPAIIIGSIAVVVAVVAILVVAMTGGPGKPELNPEMNSATSVQKQRPVTIIASGTVVVRVISREGTLLFDGTMASGQSKTIDVSGPVEIRYNNGQNLMVERDGQRQGMGKSGLGRSIIK
jgi:cytoskeleton protein RodZ